MRVAKPGDIYTLNIGGITILFTKYEIEGDLIWLYKGNELVTLLHSEDYCIFLEAFNKYLSTVYEALL